MGELVERARGMSYEQFAKELSEVGGYIAGTLTDHIFKEDNILYPTALEILRPQEWDEVLEEFERVGYCSFTPGKE